MSMLVQVLVGAVLIVGVGGVAAIVSMALQRRARRSHDLAYRHRAPRDLRVTAREAERPYPPDPEEPARLIVGVGGVAAIVSMALQRRARRSHDLAYRHRAPHDLRVTAREAERPYPPDPEAPAPGARPR